MYSAEDEDSVVQAEKSRMIQVMRQHDTPPPPQHQPLPMSSLTLAELSITGMPMARSLSLDTADAAEFSRALPPPPLPPVSLIGKRQALKDLMQLASPQLLQTLVSSDLARLCLMPMLDADDAAKLEAAAMLGSTWAAPGPSVAAAPEPAIASARHRQRDRISTRISHQQSHTAATPAPLVSSGRHVAPGREEVTTEWQPEQPAQRRPRRNRLKASQGRA